METKKETTIKRQQTKSCFRHGIQLWRMQKGIRGKHGYLVVEIIKSNHGDRQNNETEIIDNIEKGESDVFLDIFIQKANKGNFFLDIIGKKQKRRNDIFPDIVFPDIIDAEEQGEDNVGI